MNKAVAGHDVRTFQVKFPTFQISDQPTSLFNQKRARSQIPGFKFYFPEAIKTTTGSVTQIKSS